jgi:hypothetical protein
MKALATLFLLMSFASLFADRDSGWRWLGFLVSVLAGIAFTLIGGFAYWWDASMQPSRKSAYLLICGVLTLLLQSVTILYVFFQGEASIGPPVKRHVSKRKQ